MGSALRYISQKVFKSHQARGASENIMTNLRLDVDHQFLEDLERFCFVLNERITLAMCPEANTVAQTIHLVQMLLPELVYRAEDRITLHFFKRIRILKADLQLIGVTYFV